MKQLLNKNPFFYFCSKLDKSSSVCYENFNPNLLGLFLKYLSVHPVFIIIPDSMFNFFYNLIKNDFLLENCILVPPLESNMVAPRGFESLHEKLFKSTKSVLASGSHNKTILTCNSSKDARILGAYQTGAALDCSSSFDDFICYFKKSGFDFVDTVVAPGQAAIKGGVIDFYLYGDKHPCRASFLDYQVSVMFFDLTTQLSLSVIKNFRVVANENNGLLPLSSLLKEDYLLITYEEGGALCLGRGPFKSNKPFLFKYVDLELFQKKYFDYNYFINNDVSCGGYIDISSNAIYIPAWFLDRSLIKKASGVSPGAALEINNISPGDYLVHKDFGVSRFVGLKTLYDEDDNPSECLVLGFADGGSISVNTSHLGLVSFFASQEERGVDLDSLSRQHLWARRRRAAEKKASLLVEKLLSIYAKRRSVHRDPFLGDSELEFEFLSRFPYKETADQKSVWLDIIHDFKKSIPMDRLICGDVGFGKTELAIRAAFRVVFSGKRVLVLSPSTILTNQLASSFYDRLDFFGVKIDYISRLRSVGEKESIINKILSKNNDILIGTHALLNNNIYLKNIGLVIIDEEHRFGVKQKESFKLLKRNIDVLSLSATPIPRSLNLAFSGLTSISMLQTPPLLRRPIETHICCYDKSIIKDFILFEVGRSGQVFFVHNNIKSIERLSSDLASLLPLLSIVFLHGQEKPKTIEKKMGAFIKGKIDVLVCTSIIEMGIDVSNANCIIINNAHLFGLAQLYQMRGRVGRSSRVASALLLVPGDCKLSNDASKRLKALEENCQLGSGYNVSKEDLAIRGSGDLFGYNQSGGVGSVGLELYSNMVADSISSKSLNFKQALSIENINVSLFKNGLFPDTYIASPSLRLSFYKNISRSASLESLDLIKLHLVDRFGPIPPSVESFLFEHRLKILSSFVGVCSIKESSCGVVLARKASFIKDVDMFIHFLLGFSKDANISMHFLSKDDDIFYVCFHITIVKDICSFLSALLNKLRYDKI